MRKFRVVADDAPDILLPVELIPKNPSFLARAGDVLVGEDIDPIVEAQKRTASPAVTVLPTVVVLLVLGNRTR